jgi:hypothetical protein
MPIEDWDCIAASDPSRLPDLEGLKNAAAELAGRVTKLRHAPKSDDYCGPVIFEGQGGAEFLAQLPMPNFGFAEDYVGNEDWTNPWKKAIGRRVMSKSINVTDDPLASGTDGLVGGFAFDDEGVAAQKLSLVEDGILKNFCQRRLPTHFSAHSNGHALENHGFPTIIHMSTSKPVSKDDIKRQAFELAKDAGLDYVLVIRRIQDHYHNYEFPGDTAQNMSRSYFTPSYSRQPGNPAVVERLYLSDGHRELVRGLEFNYVSLLAFRDILSAADDDRPYTVELEDYVTRHVISPTYLVGELELAAVKGEHTSLPIMPSPLNANE